MVRDLIVVVASTMVCAIALAQDDAIHERIEWTDVWVANADSDGSPRVLLVGDSIVRGYYAAVEKAMGEKVSLARYTTSKFVGDPEYLDELGLLLRRYDFDVIHLNNGLHGFGYTEAQYESALNALMAFVAKAAPDARVVWCMSTPIRSTDDLAQLDSEKNDRVIARNRIAADIMQRLGVAVDDLYVAVVEHPEYSGKDGVHFNEQGQAAQAEQVAKAIKEVLAK